MNRKISFMEVVVCWWSFFWRFAAVLIPVLILSGYFINFLGSHFRGSRFLFYFSYSFGLTMKLLIILLIFKFILGRKMGKKSSIIIPAKSREEFSEKAKVSTPAALGVGLIFFWRFAVFAFAFGVILMVLVMLAGGHLGYSKLEMASHAKLVGNLAVIPASFVVFVLMLWRSEKRRKLDIVRLETEA